MNYVTVDEMGMDKLHFFFFAKLGNNLEVQFASTFKEFTCHYYLFNQFCYIYHLTARAGDVEAIKKWPEEANPHYI